MPAPDRRAHWILALAVVLPALPFLNQAFHIDDRIYLEVAENALRKPLFPYDYPAVFEGIRAPDAASHSHLPLTSYYLAILRLVFGADREWIFHLAFLVFPLIAVWTFYDFAKRWVGLPLPAAALLAVAPGFMALSHTLMTEVPQMAFWLLAISRFPAALEGKARVRDWILLAAGLLGAAWISLLTLALMLLLGAVWFLRRFGDRIGWSAAPPLRHPWLLPAVLASPLLVWGFWYGIGYLHYDRFLLLQTAGHMDQRGAFSGLLMAAKALSFLLVAGGAALFPLALWWGFGRKRSALAAALGVGWVGLGLWGEGWGVGASFLAGLFGAAGGLAFWGFGREWLAIWKSSGSGPTAVLSRAEKCLPLLWFGGIFASCVLLYPSGSVRYTLLAFPPLILLWQASLERLIEKNPYLLRNVAWTTVALTATVSLAVCHADYRFAGVYRAMARHVVGEFGGEGKTVWFTAEWGFRHYLQTEGARLLARVEVGPKPGDVIVKPRLASPWVTLYDGNEFVRLLKQIDAPPTANPIRILDFTSHAGFYSTAWGILPYSLSDGQRWEWFNVFEVKKEYDGPVPEPEKYW